MELYQGSIHPTILNTTNNALLNDYRGIWDLFDAGGSHSFRSDCFTNWTLRSPRNVSSKPRRGSPIHGDAISSEVELGIAIRAELPVTYSSNRCRPQILDGFLRLVPSGIRQQIWYYWISWSSFLPLVGGAPRKTIRHSLQRGEGFDSLFRDRFIGRVYPRTIRPPRHRSEMDQNPADDLMRSLFSL